MYPRKWWRGSGFLILLILVGLAAPAGADTITVNSTDDSGPGSLRQAIADANPGDTINFAVTGVIKLTSDHLLISKDLTIAGPGEGRLTVSGSAPHRVFMTSSSSTVTISDLTISDGNTESSAGGIFNGSGCYLSLADCTISGNHSGNYGGGIFNFRGNLTLTNCTVSGNEARQGGGVCNDTNIPVSATGILTNCTVSGNKAEDMGGGISNQWNLTLINCTVSDNEAAEGGGIYTSDSDGDGTNVKNAIIADNTTTATGPDCEGGLNSYGYNLIEDTTNCSINEDANPGTDITGQEPNLGPLQDNGGSTETHALLSGSPAIDAGSCTDIEGTGVTRDQRGVPRPQGASCDIGAYECLSGIPVPTMTRWGVVVFMILVGLVSLYRLRRPATTGGG